MDIKPHPNADSLYIGTVQVGPEPTDTKQFCSGLVRFYDIKDLQDRDICVVNNMKPSKLRGEVSEVMALCAEIPDGADGENDMVELLVPPKSSEIGEQLKFDGHEEEIAKSVTAKKFIKLEDRLRTDWDRFVMLDGKLLKNGVGEGVLTDFIQARVR